MNALETQTTMDAMERGYQTADAMLTRRAFPTLTGYKSHALNQYDIHLFAETAASICAVGLPKREYDQWTHDFAQGFNARLYRFREVGKMAGKMVLLQQWQRDGEFGVANAPASLEDYFVEKGGRKQAAFYGLVNTELQENSWIFPANVLTPMTLHLATEAAKWRTTRFP